MITPLFIIVIETHLRLITVLSSRHHNGYGQLFALFDLNTTDLAVQLPPAPPK
jgi:hypothetical protein